MESMRGNGNGPNGAGWSQEMSMNANRAPNGMNMHEMEAAFNRGQMNMNLNSQPQQNQG